MNRPSAEGIVGAEWAESYALTPAGRPNSQIITSRPTISYPTPVSDSTPPGVYPQDGSSVTATASQTAIKMKNAKRTQNLLILNNRLPQTKPTHAEYDGLSATSSKRNTS